MSLNHYEFSSGKTFLDFEFDSEGRNGKIRKAVRYSPENANGITYFNLGFGDLNKETEELMISRFLTIKIEIAYWLPLQLLCLSLLHTSQMLWFTQKGVPLPEQDYIKWESHPIGTKSNPYCTFMGL